MAYIGKSPTGSGVRQRYVYTATGGETSLSGADDNSKTLKFTDGEYVDVHLNGVLLVQGTDYGVGTANTISSLAALAADDVVEITVYDVYNVAKINSEAMRNRWYFTATGGETSITTSEVAGLSFNANAEIEVRLNGVSLQQGVDFNTTTANQVGGLAALTAGQVVEIIHYADFQLADTVSKAAGGTFTGDVTFSNDITVSGNTTVTGNLSVTDIAGSSGLKVKQIVTNNIETNLEHGSGGSSNWSEGETTITPTNTTNPILLLINLHSKSTTNATRGNTKIIRKINSGSYSDISGNYYLYNNFGLTITNENNISLMQWDNPTRSSGDSVTYTMNLSRASGSDSVFLVGGSNHKSSITLIEFEGTNETDGA